MKIYGFGAWQHDIRVKILTVTKSLGRKHYAGALEFEQLVIKQHKIIIAESGPTLRTVFELLVRSYCTYNACRLKFEKHTYQCKLRQNFLMPFGNSKGISKSVLAQFWKTVVKKLLIELNEIKGDRKHHLKNVSLIYFSTVYDISFKSSLTSLTFFSWNRFTVSSYEFISN